MKIVAYIPPDGYVEGQGYRVSFVVEGEDGHRPTGNWPYTGRAGEAMPWFWGHDLKGAQQIATEYNAERGVTREEADLIITRSMARSVHSKKGGGV